MSLSPEQIQLRRTRIGGSDIPVLLGVSPHGTMMDLFIEKTGVEVPREESPEQTWGSEVETSILESHAKRHRLKLVRPGTILHPTLDFVSATPDALGLELDAASRPDPARPVHTLEAKNVGRWMAAGWGEDGSDDAPLCYVAQVVWEQGLVRAAYAGKAIFADHGSLVASIAGAPPREWPIPWDEDLFGTLVELARKFMVDHVRTGTPPEGWENDRSALDYVSKRWASAKGPKLAPTPELVAMVDTLKALAEKRDSFGAKHDAEKAKLLDILGREKAQGIEGLCNWSVVDPKLALVTNWEAALRELTTSLSPEAASRVEDFIALHTREVVVRAGYRSFTVTKPKKAKNTTITINAEGDAA